MPTIPLEQIVIGERDREDLGDLADLKASIAGVGLLHPIAVTSDHKLIAGGRRLAAIRELGWATTPITVVDLRTVGDVLRAEADENTCRKPLSPYEASKARERRARTLSEDAAKRRAHGKTAPGRPREDASANLAEANDATARETRKVAAVGSGYSGTTLDKVDRVRQAAERGVTTVGKGKERREAPVPAEVQAVAQQHLERLKQTGAAVDAADKAMVRALDTFIADDPGVQQATYRHEISKAFSTVRKSLLTLDAARVAELLEDLDRLTLLQADINEWFTKVNSHLRDGNVIAFQRRAV